MKISVAKSRPEWTKTEDGRWYKDRPNGYRQLYREYSCKICKEVFIADRKQPFCSPICQAKDNPLCKARINGICVHQTSDIHHQKGRVGELLTDQDYWLPVCRPCHSWIELHPTEAQKKGLSFLRLSNF